MKELGKLISEWYDSEDAVHLKDYKGGHAIMASRSGDSDRDNITDDSKYDYYDMHEHFKNNRQRTSDDERHLAAYTEGSRNTNHTLIRLAHHNEPVNTESLKKYHVSTDEHMIHGYSDNHKNLANHISALDRITKSTALPKDSQFHLYTGIGAHHDLSKLREEHGDRIHFPAYTSTSADPETALSFAKNMSIGVDGAPHSKPLREMVRINVDSNKTTHIGDHLGDVNGTEHEFLLRRGAVMRFKGEPKVIEHKGRKVIVHDAHLEGFSA